MNRVSAKIAPTIVQQTSVDQRLLSSTGNSEGVDTSVLNICQLNISSNNKFYLFKCTYPAFPLQLPMVVSLRQKPIIILRLMNLQSDNQTLVILTNKPPLRSENVYHMLIFEWVLMAYYVYLFGSIINSGVQYQLRIIIYCIVFLLFEKLELTYKYLQFEDPLHLMPLTKCIRFIIYLCVLNISLLLIRIIIDNHNIHAFIIFMHFLLTIVFFLNEISKKNTKLDINIDQNTLFSKIVTPILLFIFNKTSQSSLSEFWFIEFLVFATNLFVTVQLQRILLLKECQYFGWRSFEESGKSKSNWHKRRALRTIIVICCILIVTQNLLLIFDKIKYEISVTIWHTFAIAALSYLLYSGYFPFKK